MTAAFHTGGMNQEKAFPSRCFTEDFLEPCADQATDFRDDDRLRS